MLKKIISKLSQVTCNALSELPSFGVFSFILGSQAGFFSVAQCFGPLTGLFGGVLSTSIFFILRIGIVGLLKSISFYLLTLYHIPTFCGALYLSSKSYFIRIGLPLACMALFITHPVGGQAFYYSLYWIIPVLCAFSTRSIFIQALGSTFTTHAIGSVLWLYTHSLRPSDWHMLTGIVWVERLLMALAITTSYYALVYAYSFIAAQLSTKYNTSA